MKTYHIRYPDHTLAWTGEADSLTEALKAAYIKHEARWSQVIQTGGVIDLAHAGDHIQIYFDGRIMFREF